ncbi:6553_t:CDS:2, partial [Scutellospora calospora]
ISSAMAPMSSLLTFGLLALPAVLAHPGHDVSEEAAERAESWPARLAPSEASRALSSVVTSPLTTTPTITQGPYYVDGELIRGDITDGREGVPLYLDIQLVDTSTCEPVPAVYMDLWHCNSTG